MRTQEKWVSLWRRWPRLTLSTGTFSLIAAALLVSLYNRRFWGATVEAIWYEPVESTLFVVSLYVVLVLFHAAVLSFVPGQRVLKIVVSLLFVIGAIGAYFADSYGVGIDKEMIRNVFETDPVEAAGLLSGTLAVYFLLLGVLPALLLSRCMIVESTWLADLKGRLLFICVSVLFAGVLVLVNSASFASFLRTHKPVRYLLTPGNIVQAVIRYGNSSAKSSNPILVDLGGPIAAGARDPDSKPLLMFLVVGETARAGNFQLGGYSRPTNPQLSHEPVVYFNQVSACGTATAISLPCMFSQWPREQFDVAVARQHTNLLDFVSKAGWYVEWRDNNSGCKGVCARVTTLEFSSATHPQQCSKGYCYDEVMLSDLGETLKARNRDSLVVFHQIGSHGPAYAGRYPPPFEVFKPACQSNQLQRCSRDEVRNAYDNSILYTDYNLDEQIHLLRQLGKQYDTALLYVSDHGESLGERGVYLHAAPYVIASKEQIRIPLLIWLSNAYQRRFGVDLRCLRDLSAGQFSHQNLLHTVLGALGLKNRLYERKLDILSPCRDMARRSVTPINAASNIR